MRLTVMARTLQIILKVDVMNVIVKDNGKNGAFVAVNDGVELGDMTFVWNGDKAIIIDHTGVDPRYKGQGIGKAMFEKAVDFAREKNITVIPTCRFVVAMFARTPSARDVL
ncbi:putative GNAT family acetyltransferase [Dysgonomonadaceae bacterium PH5-43]|nr:putative GNAT family acetyltransferase [Dysgonomonadaceae bacterium PH5-43]